MSRALVRLSRPFRPRDAVRAQPPDDDPCPSRGAPDLLSRWRAGNGPVSGVLHGLTERCAIAVNPWEPHGFIPGDLGSGGLFLVLYIDRSWFQRMAPVRPIRCSNFGRSEIEMTPRIRAIVREVVSLLEDYDTADNFDGTLFELTDACFEQSWRLAGGWQRYCGPASSFIDFRVRKSIVLMSEKLGSEIELDDVARDAGLSRPHFYKLFRRQTGVTPEHLPEYAAHGESASADRPDQPVDHRDRPRARLLLPERVHAVLFLPCRDGADRLPARRAGPHG